MLIDEKTRKNLEYLLFSITLKQPTKIDKYNKLGNAGDTLSKCFGVTAVDDISTFIKTDIDLILFLKCLMTVAWANMFSEKWNSVNGDYFKFQVEVDEDFDINLTLSPPKFPSKQEFVLVFVFKDDTYFGPVYDFQNREAYVWLTAAMDVGEDFNLDIDYTDKIFPITQIKSLTLNGLRQRIEDCIEKYRK